MKRFLLRHLGNMGDMIFFLPPVLETLKNKYPGCHITFVTAWGYKETVKQVYFDRGLPRLARRAKWGERNQGGFSIHLIMTNPHIDQLVHWHDTKVSLDKTICQEDGQVFPTWNPQHYEKQKKSGTYDGVYELDFGMGYEDNPLRRIYDVIGMPNEEYSDYKIYLTDKDKAVAEEVMQDFPRPRIVLLEGLEGVTTRGWDPGKILALEAAVENAYGTKPIWFGGRHTREYQGRMLSLRENIATLAYCDAAIGVMSGPMHFAAAVGLPTITLYGDQPLHRAAPAYFLNPYIRDEKKFHRTILGPTGSEIRFLKDKTTFVNLTPAEARSQGYKDWQRPGRQSTKSCVAVITVDEVMKVLRDVVNF